PSSRASSLPQGHQCRRAFAWLETQPTCVSNPHVLKTPRPCVSVSHVLKTPRPCVSVSHGLKTPRPCVSVSHGPKAPRPCGSELARERGCTSAENASTETPSSRASSLPQGHQCRRAFAWLETPSTCVSNPHGLKTPRPCVSVSHGLKTPRPCGSELARERVCTNAENASTETPPSRASSLSQGHQCRRAFAWLETQPTCVSNPHSLKTPRTCVSVSHGLKTTRTCVSVSHGSKTPRSHALRAEAWRPFIPGVTDLRCTALPGAGVTPARPRVSGRAVGAGRLRRSGAFPCRYASRR
ncbi:hypothetical protein SAMN05444507_105423, partial [Pseudomonas syringae]